MGKKYMDTKVGTLEESVLGVWKDAYIPKTTKVVEEGLEDSPNPANSQHLCAKNVVHEEWGNGQTIPTMHADPDEDGDIAWYDVMFEHGIEEGVLISELKVTKSEMHLHSSKKKKNEAMDKVDKKALKKDFDCLLYTSPSPRDRG